MNKTFLIFFAFYSFAQAEERHWFFCDYLGVPLLEKENHTNTSPDQVFSYRKSNENWTATFGSAKIKRGFLYGHFSAGQVGSHAVNWLSFYVYRFHLENKKLTKSVVYYSPTEDYEKGLKERASNPYLIPYSQKPLEFIEKEIPENYVKYGFDKSEWQCHEISYFMYLLRKIERELALILSI